MKPGSIFQYGMAQNMRVIEHRHTIFYETALVNGHGCQLKVEVMAGDDLSKSERKHLAILIGCLDKEIPATLNEAGRKFNEHAESRKPSFSRPDTERPTD